MAGTGSDGIANLLETMEDLLRGTQEVNEAREAINMHYTMTQVAYHILEFFNNIGDGWQGTFDSILGNIGSASFVRLVVQEGNVDDLARHLHSLEVKHMEVLEGTTVKAAAMPTRSSHPGRSMQALGGTTPAPNMATMSTPTKRGPAAPNEHRETRSSSVSMDLSPSSRSLLTPPVVLPGRTRRTTSGLIPSSSQILPSGADLSKQSAPAAALQHSGGEEEEEEEEGDEEDEAVFLTPEERKRIRRESQRRRARQASEFLDNEATEEGRLGTLRLLAIGGDEEDVSEDQDEQMVEEPEAEEEERVSEDQEGGVVVHSDADDVEDESSGDVSSGEEDEHRDHNSRRSSKMVLKGNLGEKQRAQRIATRQSEFQKKMARAARRMRREVSKKMLEEKDAPTTSGKEEDKEEEQTSTSPRPTRTSATEGEADKGREKRKVVAKAQGKGSVGGGLQPRAQVEEVAEEVVEERDVEKQTLAREEVYALGGLTSSKSHKVGERQAEEKDTRGHVQKKATEYQAPGFLNPVEGRNFIRHAKATEVRRQSTKEEEEARAEQGTQSSDKAVDNQKQGGGSHVTTKQLGDKKCKILTQDKEEATRRKSSRGRDSEDEEEGGKARKKGKGKTLGVEEMLDVDSFLVEQGERGKQPRRERGRQSDDGKILDLDSFFANLEEKERLKEEGEKKGTSKKSDSPSKRQEKTFACLTIQSQPGRWQFSTWAAWEVLRSKRVTHLLEFLRIALGAQLSHGAMEKLLLGLSTARLKQHVETKVTESLCLYGRCVEAAEQKRSTLSEEAAAQNRRSFSENVLKKVHYRSQPFEKLKEEFFTCWKKMSDADPPSIGVDDYWTPPPRAK